MIYQAIENLARLIMEWVIRKQENEMYLIDEVADKFSYRATKNPKS